jgi:WbqC-like protein family
MPESISVPTLSNPLTSYNLQLSGRKVAIMQPYFLPYLGYFQLFAAADVVVIHDDVQYTKQSWINRNRMFLNGRIEFISIDLIKDSYHRKINERQISPIYFNNKAKQQLQRIKSNYDFAPYANDITTVLSEILLYPEIRLSQFLMHAIRQIMLLLEMQKTILLASELAIDNTLKGQDRVIDICRKLNGDIYINPIGGLSLYNDADFSNAGLDLWFLKPGMPETQTIRQSFEHPSIIDLLMHNPVSDIKSALSAATLHKQDSIPAIHHA